MSSTGRPCSIYMFYNVKSFRIQYSSLINKLHTKKRRREISAPIALNPTYSSLLISLRGFPVSSRPPTSTQLKPPFSRYRRRYSYGCGLLEWAARFHSSRMPLFRYKCLQTLFVSFVGRREGSRRLVDVVGQSKSSQC